jgi:hypothetical protein
VTVPRVVGWALVGVLAVLDLAVLIAWLRELRAALRLELEDRML